MNELARRVRVLDSTRIALLRTGDVKAQSWRAAERLASVRSTGHEPCARITDSARVGRATDYITEEALRLITHPFADNGIAIVVLN